MYFLHVLQYLGPYYPIMSVSGNIHVFLMFRYKMFRYNSIMYVGDKTGSKREHARVSHYFCIDMLMLIVGIVAEDGLPELPPDSLHSVVLRILLPDSLSVQGCGLLFSIRTSVITPSNFLY